METCEPQGKTPKRFLPGFIPPSSLKWLQKSGESELGARLAGLRRMNKTPDLFSYLERVTFQPLTISRTVHEFYPPIDFALIPASNS